MPNTPTGNDNKKDLEQALQRNLRAPKDVAVMHKSEFDKKNNVTHGLSQGATASLRALMNSKVEAMMVADKNKKREADAQFVMDPADAAEVMKYFLAKKEKATSSIDEKMPMQEIFSYFSSHDQILFIQEISLLPDLQILLGFLHSLLLSDSNENRQKLALKAVHQALDGLTPEVKEKVLQWLISKKLL